jgi:hypothetical protein
MSDITIRTSRSADAPELRHLAALDSQRLPAGELLVAETCGNIVAAYAPAADRAIADPFRHTADEVALLKLRARGARTAPVKARHGIFALPRLV